MFAKTLNLVSMTKNKQTLTSYLSHCYSIAWTDNYKKAQLSLTNPRDACEKFARFT